MDPAIADYAQEIGSYLVANSTELVPQRNLFLDSMPHTASTTGGGIASSTGPTVELTHGPRGADSIRSFVASTGGLPLFAVENLKVTVRSTGGQNAQPDARPAYLLATKLWRLLEGFPPNSPAVSSGDPMTLNTVSRPFLMAQDDSGRYLYTFTTMVHVG